MGRIYMEQPQQTDVLLIGVTGRTGLGFIEEATRQQQEGKVANIYTLTRPESQHKLEMLREAYPAITWLQEQVQPGFFDFNAAASQQLADGIIGENPLSIVNLLARNALPGDGGEEDNPEIITRREPIADFLIANVLRIHVLSPVFRHAVLALPGRATG
jgi:hypothetical protein